MLVDHNPVLVGEVYCLLDRQPLERLLTALDDLA